MWREGQQETQKRAAAHCSNPLSPWCLAPNAFGEEIDRISVLILTSSGVALLLTGQLAVFDLGLEVIAVHEGDEVETDFLRARFKALAMIRA
jgi:hypothetical protein